MTSEFDWFMVTMPIFAIVVYLIVMIGSMEKQPKFLETEGVKKLTGLVFVVLFGGGILVSLYYMILRFVDLLGSYWANSRPMPIYEFNCKDCSADSEILVRSSNWEKEVKCPECGSVRLEKKLSVFAPSSSDSGSLDMPPCSGMPSNCGRCSMDN